MKHVLLGSLLSLATLAGHAQTGTFLKVPAEAIAQLEDLKELTKAEVITVKSAKAHAEVRPDLNRLLVISADDFLRVAQEHPTKQAYLKCLDIGLSRIYPLTISAIDRQQVAEYFQELMEIVGLESSEGRLAAFVGSGAKVRK